MYATISPYRARWPDITSLEIELHAVPDPYNNLEWRKRQSNFMFTSARENWIGTFPDKPEHAIIVVAVHIIDTRPVLSLYDRLEDMIYQMHDIDKPIQVISEMAEWCIEDIPTAKCWFELMT